MCSKTKETKEFKQWAEDRMEPATINFSKDKVYRNFKLAYHDALGTPGIKPPSKEFAFEELTFYTQYAKYLLQFVEGERERHKLRYFDPVKRMWKAKYPKEV